MVKRRLLFFGAFALAVLFSLVFVSATLSGVTLVSPAASANISGTYTLNATITGTAATNVTFYWWNSTGSAWKLLCYNGTGGAGPFSCSYTTTALPDGTSDVFNVTAVNGTASATQTSNNTGITIDNTAPAISVSSPLAGWHRQNISIYANASDATMNVTNSTMYFWFGNSTGNFSKTLLTSCGYAGSATGFNCSQTFNTTVLADGNYTLWINASDTLGNVKQQSLTSVGVDNTPPTASYSCTPTGDLYAGTNVTCTCSPSDSMSRVNSSLTSYPVYPSTSGIGTFSLVCSFGDNAGNTNSTTASYHVTYAASSSNPSSSAPSATISTNQNIFESISPGTPATASGFDSKAGVKQIIINVNNKASNVQITLTAYSSRPSGVSVNASGKVFQYFHIGTQNLENLSSAKIEIRVNKSWVSGNGLNSSDISLFKFNNSSKVWNDLNAAYSGDDSSYYYYNATVTSFSYFAISGKAIVSPAESSGNVSNQAATKTATNSAAGSTWFWIIVSVFGVIVAGIVIWILIRARRS